MTANALTPWSSTLTLRDWQQRACPTILSSDRSSFLLAATPGAGKTMPALPRRP